MRGDLAATSNIVSPLTLMTLPAEGIAFPPRVYQHATPFGLRFSAFQPGPEHAKADVPYRLLLTLILTLTPQRPYLLRSAFSR